MTETSMNRYQINVSGWLKTQYVMAKNYAEALEKIGAREQDVEFTQSLTIRQWLAAKAAVANGFHTDDNEPHFTY